MRLSQCRWRSDECFLVWMFVTGVLHGVWVLELSSPWNERFIFGFVYSATNVWYMVWVFGP